MITAVVIAIVCLFVCVPSVLSLLPVIRGGDSSKVGWMLGSFVLRAAIGAGAIWLYFGGGVFERAIQSTPSIQVTALVDTSSSMLTPRGQSADFGNAAADRISEALAQLGVPERGVTVTLFSDTTTQLGGGLSALRALNPTQVGGNGDPVTRLREALATVPTSTPGAAYTLLLSDGWVDGTSDGATASSGQAGLSGSANANASQPSPDLLRVASELGQPVISLPLAPNEAWRYGQPELPRLVDIGKPSGQRYMAGGDNERAFKFAIGPSSQVQGRQSADLAFNIQGRNELVNQYACRDIEAKGVGRVIIPANPGVLIECLPLTTVADPPGASSQAVLGIGTDLQDARAAFDASQAGLGGAGTNTQVLPDRALVQFIERGYVPKLLVLDGSASEQSVPSIIASSLQNLGWTWDRVGGQQWTDAIQARAPIDLARYDAVILADFAPGNFGLEPSDDGPVWTQQRARQQVDQALRQLAAYVAQGGGLFLSGGEESFGVGGYASTPIEPLLPVQLDPKGAAGDPPIVVVGVLDVSASLFYRPETQSRAIDYMIGSFVDLPQGSQVRILGYSDEPHELVPLQRFEDVETLRQLVDEAIDDLGQEFERRRLLGLQPEGIDIYGALTAGYRTFDRLAELEAEQALLDQSVQPTGSGLAERGQELEKRLFLIMDAQDRDLLTFTRWSVDETGTFLRKTAADLAFERFEQQGVVLNSIGMTYGEGSLPPVPVIAQSENQEWRERYNAGVTIHRELDRLSDAGGGTSYLDEFEIPLGSLSRRMKDYVTDGVALAPSVNHRFLPSELVRASGMVQVPGVAVAPAKRFARPILYSDYQPQSGQALQLGVWTEWVTDAQNIRNVVGTRQAQSDSLDQESDLGDNAQTAGEPAASFDQQRAQLRFGGAVSVLTTTLRDGGNDIPGFSQSSLGQVAFVRMLDWLVQTNPRDEMRFSALRRQAIEDQPETVEFSLDISSAGDFNITAANATLWQLDEGTLRGLAGDELAEDGLPLDLPSFARQGETLTTAVLAQDQRGDKRTNNRLVARANWAQLDASMNADDAVVLDLSIEGVDARGMTRVLSYRLFVFPQLLQFAQEPASWMRGLNEPLLKDLAAISNGAHFSPDQPIQLAKAQQPLPIDTLVELDFRWIVALLMILAFIGDFIVREYRIGREE